MQWPYRARKTPNLRIGSISHMRRVTGWSVVIASGLMTGICGIGQIFGTWEPMELAVFNRLTQRQANRGADARLLMVSITEADVRQYGWPLSDQTLAEALQQIQDHQPRVIGLDLYRDISVPPGDKALLQGQLKADNVVAIANLIDGIPPPMIEPERIGFNDFTLDPDGVLRRNLMFVAADQDYYSFALRVALAYAARDGIEFRYTPDALWLGEYSIPILQPTSGGYQKADNRGYQTLLRYRSRDAVGDVITLAQLLDPSFNQELGLDLITDRAVLIGSVAPSLKDLIETPYSSLKNDAFLRMPGVEIHAQMVSQLLDVAAGDPALFQFWPQSLEYLWIWTWAMVGGVMVWWLRHPGAIALATALGVLMMTSLGWLLFTQLIWIPIATPIFGFVGAIALVMGYRLLYTMTRDSLTGLLNQDAFLHHLGQWFTSSTPSLSYSLSPLPLPVSVIVLKLDRFQLLRNSLGHYWSNRVLLEISPAGRQYCPAQLVWREPATTSLPSVFP